MSINLETARDRLKANVLECDLFDDYSTPRPLRYDLDGDGVPVRRNVPTGTRWIEFTVNPAPGQQFGSVRITKHHSSVPSELVGQLWTNLNSEPHTIELSEKQLDHLCAFSPDGAGLFIEYMNVS